MKSEDHYLRHQEHFDYIDEMNGGDCDCNLHQIMSAYLGEEE